MSVDILVTGTGQFAGRIVLDLAATAREPVCVMIAGRNSERLDWLRTAGNARARMFGTPARILSHRIDLLADGASDTILEIAQPNLVVQAASIQTSAIIAQTGTQWSSLVAAGGLSATAVFQALLTSRMARAIQRTAPHAALINCAFPDVVNGMITQMGYPVLCGTGNVAILSNVFDGLCADGSAPLRVLAHYQNLEPWRRAPELRSDARPPRVFIGDAEVDDVFERFSAARLTREPAIEISGASGVSLMLAYVGGRAWQGHAPGPAGLPGGYPVRLCDGRLALDLPHGITQDDAVRWNAGFEKGNGLTAEGGLVAYHGSLAACLRDAGFPHADGFPLTELETVCRDLMILRDRLSDLPA